MPPGRRCDREQRPTKRARRFGGRPHGHVRIEASDRSKEELPCPDLSSRSSAAVDAARSTRRAAVRPARPSPIPSGKGKPAAFRRRTSRGTTPTTSRTGPKDWTGRPEVETLPGMPWLVWNVLVDEQVDERPVAAGEIPSQRVTS